MHILGGGRFCQQGLWSFGTCVLPYFNFLFTFLVFWDRVSLCSPGCPGNHSVDQAVLEPRNPPVSASQVLELKACATPFLFILFKYVCLHVLCVCMFMSGALRGQKVTHLELKFHDSQHVCAGNCLWVLCKNSVTAELSFPPLHVYYVCAPHVCLVPSEGRGR